MRKFKDIKEEAFEQALDTAKETFEKRDAIQAEIKAEILQIVETEETYDEFEDSLFIATERAIY